MRFPESGRYVVPGPLDLVVIDRERDLGKYVEPNVLMFASRATCRLRKPPKACWPLEASVVNVVIRAATEQDAQAVGALAQQFAAYLRGLGDRADFQLNAETFIRDGFGPNPAFSGLVADLDGRVVGYLLYYFGYDADLAIRTLHVADLYVHEANRRSGFGRALMAAVADVCKEQNGQRLVWAVYRPNRDAFAFYERLGAVHMEEMRLMYLPV